MLAWHVCVLISARLKSTIYLLSSVRPVAPVETAPTSEIHSLVILIRDAMFRTVFMQDPRLFANEDYIFAIPESSRRPGQVDDATGRPSGGAVRSPRTPRLGP